MKKSSFITLAAAAFIAIGFCSCSTDRIDDYKDFDHFEVTYVLETNEDCRNCFDADFEIIFDGKVEETGPVTIKVDGEYTNSKVGPNTTITFQVVPAFKAEIPDEIDLLLKYDVNFMATAKDGTVLADYAIRGSNSYDGKIKLSTEEQKKRALADYSICFTVRSDEKDGKISFVEANGRR